MSVDAIDFSRLLLEPPLEEEILMYQPSVLGVHEDDKLQEEENGERESRRDNSYARRD